MDRPAQHRGYTLLEVIVVLAVVASLLAIMLPALRRPLGKTELREAAKQVQAALLESRTRAVESGDVQEFRYEPGGRRYEILARGEEEAGPSAMTNRGAAEAPLGSAKSAALEPLRDVLPTGVVFADPQEEVSAEPRAASPKMTPVVTEDEVTGQRWSTPVRFYPNGRSSNSRLKLRGMTSWSIEILLRGLTGMALVGEPRRQQTTQETSSRESWRPDHVSDSR